MLHHLFAALAVQAAAWVYLLKQAEKFNEKLWNYDCLLGCHRQKGLQFCEDSQRRAHAGPLNRFAPEAGSKAAR